MKSIYLKRIFTVILTLSICTISTNVYSQRVGGKLLDALKKAEKTVKDVSDEYKPGRKPTTGNIAKDTMRHTSENEAVVLGTLEDYIQTINTLTSDNGFRTVSIGWNTHVDNVLPSSKEYGKLGLIDKYGNFILEPIYDRFLDAYEHENIRGIGLNPKLRYFTNGYMRVVRDGKMGMVNMKGEEVIPCIYDYVQEPNEGISAVYKATTSSSYYVGYWSLEQNIEILKPDTYYARSAGLLTGEEIENGKILQCHDFNGGYAMVYTEPLESQKYDVKATLIDKNGANAYGGKSYSVSAYGDYPQRGELLVFVELQSFKDYTYRKFESKNEMPNPLDVYIAYVAGVANKNGILVEPQYIAGANATVGEGSTFMDDAVYNLQNNAGLISISIDKDKGFLYGGAIGIIKPNGEIVVPFSNKVRFGKILLPLIYNWEYEVFTGSQGDQRLYSKTGKRLSGNKEINFVITNGYTTAIEYMEYDPVKNHTPHRTYMMNTKGDVLDISELAGGNYKMFDEEVCTDFSTAGNFWLKDMNNKWGLFDFSGKAIIPFTYDEMLTLYGWGAKDKKYTLVKLNDKYGIIDINGRLMVPCEYEKLHLIEGDYVQYARDTYLEKYGLLDIVNNKEITEQKYDALRSRDNMPLYVATLNNKSFVIDENGEEIEFNPNAAGIYDYKRRLIVPQKLLFNQNLEVGNSFLPIIKGDKVVRVSVNYLDKTFAYKNYPPNGLENASPSYMAARRDAHENERRNAIDNPYKRKPMLEEAYVKFVSTPNKNNYEVGEKYDTAGLRVYFVNIYGDNSNISNTVKISLNGETLRHGDRLRSSHVGAHNIKYTCRGETVTSKIVIVSAGVNDNRLQDGDYYLMLMGKYLVPVQNYIELSDQKPERPFTLKFKSYDDNSRPLYMISYGRRTLNSPASNNGTQLELSDSNFTRWRVSKYSNFCTIRLASRQSMIVNASGEKGDNGTPVIIWEGKGSAPNHAKVQAVAY